MKILMVCLGNICRSPVAEGIMKAKLEHYGIDAIVDSAGLFSFHCGEHPDKRAIASARSGNIDISSQIARQVSKNDFNEFDLIFAMDSSVYDELLNMVKDKSQAAKIHLLLEFAGNENVKDVPDPYYGDSRGFKEVFDMINDACETIALNIMKGK